MKKLKSFLAVILALTMILSFAVMSFAKSGVFSSRAYATIVTGSDFQDSGKSAFNRFAAILTLMKNDGMPTPHSVLAGGDYSKMLPDYATPGVSYVKDAYLSVFPEANSDSVVCAQGNHDIISSGFTKTGYYDMGAYNLFVINEDNFNWNQFLLGPTTEKLTASKLEKAFNNVIDNGDMRPFIVLTHVPLHHTTRTMSGDNMYSSYLFNVINKAAEKLDVIFLFGHNHSNAHDDYIGGSVNFLAPGDTIRIPITTKHGEDCYTEETLNFTYANCGYVGYSKNGTENGSTNKLTAGAIQFTEDLFRFVKYSEEGVFETWSVDRKNTGTETGSGAEITTELVNRGLYEIIVTIVKFLTSLGLQIVI